MTAEHIQSLLDAGLVLGGGAAGPCGSTDLIQVISAFDVPKILYDPIRKGFYRAPKPTSLLGTAQVSWCSRGLVWRRLEEALGRIRKGMSRSSMS